MSTKRYNTIKLDFDLKVTSDEHMEKWFTNHLPLTNNDSLFLHHFSMYNHIWLCNDQVCWQQGHDRIADRRKIVNVFYHDYPDLIHFEINPFLDPLVTLFLLSFPFHAKLINIDTEIY